MVTKKERQKIRNIMLLSWAKGFSWSLDILSGSVGDPESEPDTDPHVFGPPGSGSIRRRGSGSGSFPFLINVLSGLKQCQQNKILTQNFSQKLNFLD
jgi:hypothetical protein